MVELLTCDFWETLFADSAGTGARAHALWLAGVGRALRRAGHGYDAATLAAVDARAATAFDAIWRKDRSMSAAEQAWMFLAALDPALPAGLSTASLAEVRAAYEEPALTHGPDVAPGVVAALGELRARGFVLGVISNTGRTPGTVLRRLLERVGVLGCFRVLSFSDEVGVRKPAPQIFHQTLTIAGVAPECAVHLGDDPVSDVVGARAVGMRAIHYVPEGRPPTAPADGVLRHFDDLPALLTRLG